MVKLTPEKIYQIQKRNLNNMKRWKLGNIKQNCLSLKKQISISVCLFENFIDIIQIECRRFELWTNQNHLYICDLGSEFHISLNQILSIKFDNCEVYSRG